jgi:hypothetical protein
MSLVKYNPIHAKNPKGIICEACKTLGLSIEEFLASLESELGYRINLDDPTVSEWVYMCRLLILDVDSISYGYLDYFHKNRIKNLKYENQNSTEQFPGTTEFIEQHLNTLLEGMNTNDQSQFA